MSEQIADGLTKHWDLPALQQALDPDYMSSVIGVAAGWVTHPGERLDCSAEVLARKSGHWTIKYTLSRAGGQDGSLPPLVIIGKVYRKPKQAKRMTRWTEDLRRAFLDVNATLGVPAPLVALSDPGVFLQEYVDGSDLRHFLTAGQSATPLARAAHWLAKLHCAVLIPDLEPVTPERELKHIEAWQARVAPILAPAEAARLLTAVSALKAAAVRPSYIPAMVHGDFHPANVLWDGVCAWGVDLDQICIGDPARDVGCFLAQLEKLAFRETGRIDAYAKEAQRFKSEYETSAGNGVLSRVPYYKSYTFLQLAATDVARQRKGWERSARLLADLCCRQAG